MYQGGGARAEGRGREARGGQGRAGEGRAGKNHCESCFLRFRDLISDCSSLFPTASSTAASPSLPSSGRLKRKLSILLRTADTSCTGPCFCCTIAIATLRAEMVPPAYCFLPRFPGPVASSATRSW